MKVTVLHDEQGRILALSSEVDLEKSGSKFTKVGMLAGPGQRKLEMDVDSLHDKKGLLERHQQFRVDITTCQLVKK